MSDDIEIIDPENYSSEKGKQFSHSFLVMSVMRKCIEAGSKEMRSGWFNQKIDKNGNTVLTYIDDTRKQFIESVKTAEMILICDYDKDIKEQIGKIEEYLKTKYKKLCSLEKNDWEKAHPLIKNSRMQQGIYYKEGYLNEDLHYSQVYLEEEVDAYREIFKELTKLTKRLDFYEEEAYEN